MAAVVAEISMALDGYVAGPDATLDEPLGGGGEQLHEWAFGSRAWRHSHGMEGGEATPSDSLIDEMVAAGATVMGRRMYSGGEGAWDRDPNANGWWGDEPPFHHPVFVLTHHPREPLTLGETTFTFVTEGVDSAVQRARATAGGKRVTIGGGAAAIREALGAGLVDELRVNLVPVLLGDGVSLFERGEAQPRLEIAAVAASPAVTHLAYRVLS